MNFSDICPFVRYARYMTASSSDNYFEVIPYDSRIFYTVSGDGEIRAGDTEYKMKSGSLLILPSGMPYMILTPTEEVRYAILNFDYTDSDESKRAPIAPATSESFKKDELIAVPDFCGDISANSAIFIKNALPIGELITDTVREYSRRMLYFEEKCSSQLAAALFEIYRRQSTGGSYFDVRIDDILSYVDMHFAEDLSNKKIAEVFSFHQNHISAVIKQATGMPLHKYLIHTRLRHAIDMLDSGEKSISAVSEACGFFDVAHFSRTFKSVFGYNPKSYGLN